MAAITEAGRAGKAHLAMPSLGCGVNGWSPAQAAAQAIEAAVSWLASTSSEARTVSTLDFVLRCDATWDAWRDSAQKRFGPPSSAASLLKKKSAPHDKHKHEHTLVWDFKAAG